MSEIQQLQGVGASRMEQVTQRMGRLRQLGLIALSAVTLFAVTACGPEDSPTPPPSDSGAIKVLTYNMRGGLRDKDDSSVDADKTRLADVLAERLVAEKPRVVMLQEACESQVDRTVAAMAGRSGLTKVLFVRDTRYDNCPGENKWLGKAILTDGTSQEIYNTGNKPDGSPADFKITDTKSAVGCVRWFGAAIPINACVVHIHGDETPSVAKEFVRRLWGPLIIAGDFNEDVDSKRMGGIYSSHIQGNSVGERNSGYMYEVDMCPKDNCAYPTRNGEATHRPSFSPFGIFSEKIDYIFADDTHFSPQVRGWTESTSDQCGGKKCSDHYMLWGEIRLADRPNCPSDAVIQGVANDVANAVGARNAHVLNAICEDPYTAVWTTYEASGPADSIIVVVKRDTSGGQTTYNVVSKNAIGECQDQDIPLSLKHRLGCAS